MTDSSSNDGSQAATATDTDPGTSSPQDGFDVDAWQAFATETELTPEEARRRIDHSRTWERRAKDNREAAQRLPELEQATQELTTRAETAEGRVAELEPENLRLRVALDTGLPSELIDRLKGDTEEELRVDADSLLQLVVPAEGDGPRAPRPVPSQGGDGGTPSLNGNRLLTSVNRALGIS